MTSPDKALASKHFLLERVSALLLIPLMIWLCISISLLPSASYEPVIHWLQQPFNSIMMGLIIVIGFKHAQLGMQVVIEDYVSHPTILRLSLSIVQLLSYSLMLLGIYAILKIVLSPASSLLGSH